MGAIDLETRTGVTTLADVAAETGLPLDTITAWSDARHAEHSVAVDVLFRGGEPLSDPPEPFLTILRQAQSDCQDFERSRLILQNWIDRGDVPERVAPPEPTPLRPELDPIPFDAERHTRLREAIFHVSTARAAGNFDADLVALMRAMGVPEDVELDLDALAAIETREHASIIATTLMLPIPRVLDIRAEELVELVRRMGADPQAPEAVYYGGLLAANIDVAGTPVDGDDAAQQCYMIEGLEEAMCLVFMPQ